jgi:hypothetical protein
MEHPEEFRELIRVLVRHPVLVATGMAGHRLMSR